MGPGWHLDLRGPGQSLATPEPVNLAITGSFTNVPIDTTGLYVYTGTHSMYMYIYIYISI